MALAQSLKLTDKYNVTLTTAFFFLVLERRSMGQTWEDFAAQHSDLLDWQRREKFLDPFYNLAELDSAAARQGFLTPHLTQKEKP